VDNISCTITGKLGNFPELGTTRNGKAMTSFSLAVNLPPRQSGGDGETRWFRVYAFDQLAEHVSSSLVKGDTVTVRAADISGRAYVSDRDPEQKPRAQVTITAQDVAASMRWETLTTAKADRAARQPADGPQPADDPWAGEAPLPGDREVPEVLAGVTR
jgi:single-strand DNA-binding protein